MADAITMRRDQNGGRYEDVIDASNWLALEYGNATNALAVMARQSKLYEAAKKALSKSNGKNAKRTATG